MPRVLICPICGVVRNDINADSVQVFHSGSESNPHPEVEMELKRDDEEDEQTPTNTR